MAECITFGAIFSLFLKEWNNMIDVGFYQKQTARRRDWVPIPLSPKQVLPYPDAYKTVSKALSLRCLELTVGDWIEQELNKHNQLPESVVSLLRKNIQDETRHDVALWNVDKVMPSSRQDILTALELKSQLKELADKYSPIVVAGTIEASIFFILLPMYRFLGSPGLRTVANDISNDENIHVAVNIQLAKDFGYNRGSDLDKFREECVQWLVSDLSNTHEIKWLSKEHWVNASRSLYNAGKAPQLKETRASVMPAFFEHNNMDLPKYS